MVAKNIRMTNRSRKPEKKQQKKENNKVPPEVEEMRRYLGIIPDEWALVEPSPQKEEA